MRLTSSALNKVLDVFRNTWPGSLNVNRCVELPLFLIVPWAVSLAERDTFTEFRVPLPVNDGMVKLAVVKSVSVGPNAWL